jgi:predicted nucleic acid-binding protein
LLTANRLLLVKPDDLSEIDSGRPLDQELNHAVGTFGLDANDSLILIEAARAGVTDIVTMDTDLRRAQADFTIYTWL